MTWPHGADTSVNSMGPYVIGRAEGTSPPLAANVEETKPSTPVSDFSVTNTQHYLANVLDINGSQQGTVAITDPAEVVLQGQDAAGTSYNRF
jgi:hypothetical protein